MSWTPPCRSRPSFVAWVRIAAAEPAIRPRTISRTSRWRRRSDIQSAEERLLRRCEDEQKPAVIVVGGEEIRHRLRGQISLRVDGHALAQLPDAPLEHGPHGVIAALEGEPEHLPDLAA